jgi:hypothetical protein
METALTCGAWAVFGLLLANQAYIQSGQRGRQMPWFVALRSGFLDAALWAVTTLVIFWLARRFPLERGRAFPRTLIHIAAAIVLSLARTGVMVVLGWYLPWVGPRTFSVQFWSTSSLNVLFYALLLGIAHLGFYYARFREREQAAEQLRRGLTEARLQALKMQLPGVERARGGQDLRAREGALAHDGRTNAGGTLRIPADRRRQAVLRATHRGRDARDRRVRRADGPTGRSRVRGSAGDDHHETGRRGRAGQRLRRM